MKKTILSVSALFIVLAMVLSACGGTTAEEPAESGDKTTLRIWTHQNTAFLNGYTALADKYMDLNPDVEIVIESFDYDTFVQTLQTSLPAGTEADILTL